MPNELQVQFGDCTAHQHTILEQMLHASPCASAVPSSRKHIRRDLWTSPLLCLTGCGACSRLSLAAVLVSLVSLCMLQITGASSDMYLVSTALDKRSWALVWGAVACLTVLGPSFYHYRALAAVALTALSFTAVYSAAAAAVGGQAAGVTHAGPVDAPSFFAGAARIASGFGGHVMLV